MSETRKEKPSLHLRDVSVSFHFVERAETVLKSTGDRDSTSSEFRSIEMDLLAYQFQIRPPFRTEPVGKNPTGVTIVFPDSLHYYSEGRDTELRCEKPRREAIVHVSRTTFFDSGVRVWHLCLSPVKGEAFTEFDLVKLIHVYDGRSENTHLDAQVKFQLEGKEKKSITQLAGELVCPVSDKERMPVLRLNAGTIGAFLPTDYDTTNFPAILDTMRRLGKNSDAELDECVGRWVSDRTREGRILMALCGITAGILDFDQIGVDEIKDTVRQIVECSSGFLKVHRATVVHFFQADLERFQEFFRRMGANPYLLIPHAVLLHNECLVAEAAKKADEIVDHAHRSPRGMEDTRRLMDRNLNRHLIPNVFNYETERTLVEVGVIARGSDEYLRATRRKLEELGSLLTEARTRQQENGQLVVSVLVFAITMMQVPDKLNKFLPSNVSPRVSWIISGVLFVVGVLSYVWVRYGKTRSARKVP